jgi:spermidine/putrescine transport system substrate-binding protein
LPLFLLPFLFVSSVRSGTIPDPEPPPPEKVRILCWRSYPVLPGAKISGGGAAPLSNETAIPFQIGKRRVVQITETYEDQDELVWRIANSPGIHDVILGPFGDIDRLAHEGLLLRLDRARLPNRQPALPELRQAKFREMDSPWMIPFMFGTFGIVSRKDHVPDEIRSWKEYFQPNPKWLRRLAISSDPCVTLGAALLSVGRYSPDPGFSMSRDAIRMVYLLKSEGFLGELRRDSESLSKKLLAGTVSLGIFDSGVAEGLLLRHTDLIRFTLPAEGSLLSLHGFAIIRNSENQELAYEYINHQIAPEIQAANSLYQFYGCPSAKTRDLILKIAPQQSDTRLYPEPKIWARIQGRIRISQDSLALWDQVIRPPQK